MTTSHRGPIAPPRDWDALRRAYETFDGNLDDLAVSNGLKPQSLQKYARAKGWVRQQSAEPASSASANRPASPSKRAAGSRTRARAGPLAAAATRKSVAAGSAGRRRISLAGQLKRTIRLKLEKIEMDIETSGPLDPEAHERHSRALGNLTRSVEAVDELTRPGSTPRKLDTGQPADAIEAAGNDADKLRRELAARIKRLRERLER